MSRDINHVSVMINQLGSSKSEEKCAELMHYILRLMYKDTDLTPLATKIVKLLALPYPPLKKIVYLYWKRYCSNKSDINILSTNSLLKDFGDPNPYIRRIVIKTACDIPCLHDLAFHLLPKALSDNSSYVYSSAAVSCSSFINEKNIDNNGEIIDKLYEMIKDPDTSTVSSVLSTLDEILQFEGGIVINSKIAYYLMNRISDFQDWDFITVCSILKKYNPHNMEEILVFLDALDEKFNNKNPVIFFSAIDLALNYINGKSEKLTKDVIRQTIQHLKFLSSYTPEILISVLEIIESYLPQHKDLFSPLYKLMLCRFSDSVLIKVKKLKILVHLINSENCNEILEEILLSCTDNVKEVSKQAIHSFTSVLELYPLPDYVRHFILLLDINYNNVNEETLKALSKLNLNDMEEVKEILLLGVSKQSNQIKTTEGKQALLKVIANYGEHIEDAPYIIERLMNEVNIFEDEVVTTQLVITSVKLFLQRPAEMQLLLGQFLQLMKNSDNVFLRKQALVSYHFLKNQNVAKKLLQVVKD